jgi:hypothetical protein
MDTKGKYIGSANLILSNNRTFVLSAKGSYSTKTSKAKISLSGLKKEESHGIKFNLIINNDNEIIQIKGKALGQTVNYIK